MSKPESSLRYLKEIKNLKLKIKKLEEEKIVLSCYYGEDVAYMGEKVLRPLAEENIKLRKKLQYILTTKYLDKDESELAAEIIKKSRALIRKNRTEK